MMKLPPNKGFSMVELFIVAAIMSLIFGVVGLAMSRALDRTTLNADTERVISMIQRARAFTLGTKATASDYQNRQYGILFDNSVTPNKIVIFYHPKNDAAVRCKYSDLVSQARIIEEQTFTQTTVSPSTMGDAVATDPSDGKCFYFQRFTGDVQVWKGSSFSTMVGSSQIRVSTLRFATIRDLIIYPTGIIQQQ